MEYFCYQFNFQIQKASFFNWNYANDIILFMQFT